jgi:hypothetical protein
VARIIKKQQRPVYKGLEKVKEKYDMSKKIFKIFHQTTKRHFFMTLFFYDLQTHLIETCNHSYTAIGTPRGVLGFWTNSVKGGTKGYGGRFLSHFYDQVFEFIL